ncbi:hypothetical protein [Flavobacterium sp.]|jgi:hypothetical protein|uniref:hypothetical protein n=1 Tax=Flavobacterium sp. TaxID=239 RepID=UPI0037C0DF2A
MRKLFAAEDNTEENPGELLIDKLTALKTNQKEGLPLTAELIKQRNQLRQDIDKEIGKSSDDITKDNEDDKPDQKEGQSDPDAEDQPSEGQPENKDDQAKETNEAGDGEAEDIEGLTALVGSAKTGKDATESFNQRLSGLSFRSHIGTIIDRHSSYRLALEGMNLADKAQPATEQPVAYVKNEVVASLNSLIALAGKYITNNTHVVETTSKGVKTLMEQLTTYRGYHEQEKFSFTAKLINTEDVLSSLSVKGNSELKETSGVLLKYLDTMTPLVEKLLTNPLEQLPSVLKSSHFSDETGVLEYKNMLPGFFTVQAGIEPYVNYLKTNYEDYQIFRLKVLKTQDLYDLTHISISDDTTFFSVLDRADKILMNVGLCLDNLKTINNSYGDLVTKLKALVYEIEKDQKDRLSDLGIDEQLKDFIKYKLVTELYIVNIKLGVEFLTSLVSAFTVLIELKE